MYYLFSLRKKKKISTFEGVISTNKVQLTHLAFILNKVKRLS